VLAPTDERRASHTPDDAMGDANALLLCRANGCWWLTGRYD
jgi:hypothetical protein